MDQKLTDMQEKVARIAASSTELSKTEIARRAGCSRRTITKYFADPGFKQYLEELREQSRPSLSLVAATIPLAQRIDTLKKVKKLRGTYLPELSQIEDLFREVGDDTDRLRGLFKIFQEQVFRLLNDFSGEEVTVDQLNKKIAVCERVLREAGVDTSDSNPEMRAPPGYLIVSREDVAAFKERDD